MILERDSIAGLDKALRVHRDSSHYLRILAALFLGALAALFLAWFMQYLIKSSDMMLQNANRIQMLDCVRVKREETVERKDRRPMMSELSS